MPKAVKKVQNRRLWGPVKSFETLQPHASPRNEYPASTVLEPASLGYVPGLRHFNESKSTRMKILNKRKIQLPQSNGVGNISFLREDGRYYTVLEGGLQKMMVQDESFMEAQIEAASKERRLKRLIAKFKSFSYLYNEDQFINALTNDVIVVRSLPNSLKEARKENKFPTISPKSSASPSFYINEVLPKLKQSKVVGLMITDGGCLQRWIRKLTTKYNSPFESRKVIQRDGQSKIFKEISNALMISTDKSKIPRVKRWLDLLPNIFNVDSFDLHKFQQTASGKIPR
ncbi:hypothetical protein QJS10_CPA16g01546 [Acorus calamus]|uniref:O-fucosyltransferase family protein n=1 Tax=Acorus calamus TaxID=4465 RepID=A0AAV9D159_ACOCL|nr:hypothetical protein QJS10_CPA16g01546 [Acorus calamus]